MSGPVHTNNKLAVHSKNEKIPVWYGEKNPTPIDDRVETGTSLSVTLVPVAVQSLVAHSAQSLVPVAARGVEVDVVRTHLSSAHGLDAEGGDKIRGRESGAGDSMSFSSQQVAEVQE